MEEKSSKTTFVQAVMMWVLILFFLGGAIGFYVGTAYSAKQLRKGILLGGVIIDDKPYTLQERSVSK
jgi:hypothetical protein